LEMRSGGTGGRESREPDERTVLDGVVEVELVVPERCFRPRLDLLLDELEWKERHDETSGFCETAGAADRD
jgi:hypothetical protein